MATIIYGHEETLLPWAQERVGVPFRRDAYTLGLERNGSLVAVVVFDNFSDADCNMHVASDGTRSWLSKGLLLATFAYPFTQLGLRRVTAMVPAKNAFQSTRLREARPVEAVENAEAVLVSIHAPA